MNAPRRTSRLFTGSSVASRAFEAAVLLAAGMLVARLLFLPPPSPLPAAFTGLAAGVVGALSVIVGAVGGLYPLPLGDKVTLNLGSVAVFATFLLFPVHEALVLAFTGALVAQVMRRRRGKRLTPATMVFNLAQYLVTWSLAVDVFNRVLTQPASIQGSRFWVAAAAAGAVYLLVNTWVVTTWAALRRRTWTWDLCMRALRQAGPGYAASLALGTAAAYLARTQPLLTLAAIPLAALLYQIIAHMSSIIRRLLAAPLGAMIEIIEQRSPFMAEHSERVSWWAQRLARALELPEDHVEGIALAAKLHDLGRAVLPAPLEAKPDPLTDAEQAEMRQHPDVGADVVARLPGFEMVSWCIRCHHERFDGKGYPRGLQGAEIPLGARIIAVADAFDAMTSERPYRPALPMGEVLGQLKFYAGTQFDPYVVSAMVALVQADGQAALEARLKPGLQAAGVTVSGGVTQVASVWNAPGSPDSRGG